MTEEIQAELSAIHQSYQHDVANLTASKAQLAAQCGALALKLKKAEEANNSLAEEKESLEVELAELKKDKSE